jgi:hypothetical protein
VFAGTLIALGFTLLVSSFWIGLAVGSHVSWTTGVALEWWLAATAVVAAGLGGFVASRVGGIADLPSAYLTSNLVWALFFAAGTAFAFVIPVAAGFSVTTSTAWLWFPMLIVGFAAAGFGARRGVFAGQKVQVNGEPTLARAAPQEGAGVDLRERQGSPVPTGQWQGAAHTNS